LRLVLVLLAAYITSITIHTWVPQHCCCCCCCCCYCYFCF